MLTSVQRWSFAKEGFVRLCGVFTREQAAAMEERLWDRLEKKHGVRREDRATWTIPPASGLQPLRTPAPNLGEVPRFMRVQRIGPELES